MADVIEMASTPQTGPSSCWALVTTVSPSEFVSICHVLVPKSLQKPRNRNERRLLSKLEHWDRSSRPQRQPRRILVSFESESVASRTAKLCFLRPLFFGMRLVPRCREMPQKRVVDLATSQHSKTEVYHGAVDSPLWDWFSGSTRPGGECEGGHAQEARPAEWTVAPSLTGTGSLRKDRRRKRSRSRSRRS